MLPTTRHRSKPSFPPARKPLAAAVSLMLFALPALAQDADSNEEVLDRVVVTAAGFEQKIVDAPASISVVDRVELEKRPYISLIDAVRDLEGVDIGETSDKTGQKTISIRGMGADYTLVLVDGKRQNNHGDIYPNSFGGNQFNHIPPLDMIERIEVIRGPASTLYGADALGGVINIITKKVSDHWTGSASLTRTFQEDSAFGDDTTIDFAISGPLYSDVLGLTVRGSRYQRDASTPDFAPATDPDGGVHYRALGFGSGGKTVDNTNKSAGFSLSWKPTDNQSLVFDYDISRQTYDNKPIVNPDGSLSYPLGTVDNIGSIWAGAPRVGYIDEQDFDRDSWALTHEGRWGNMTSFVSLAYVETDNQGRTLPFSPEERILHSQIFRGTGPYEGMSEDARRAIMEETFLPRPKRELESNQYTLDAKFDVPIYDAFGDHHIVFGGQYIDGELTDGVFGLELGHDFAGARQEQKMYAVFAEDNWTPIDPLTITAGIRYDDHDTFGGHVSPRLYGVYNITDAWVLKGGVSTGYKTPKTTDLYDGITGFGGQGTSPWTGNPDLEPETSVNSEIALYWTSPSQAHNFNITYFQNDFDDKIISSPVTQTCADTGGVRPCANLGAYWELLGIGSLNQPINIDEAKIKGWEVAGRWQVIDSLSLRANYTHTDSEQLSGANTGRPLTNTAKHMANASVDWQPFDRFSMQLIGEMRSDRYFGVDANDNHLYYKSYTVFHLGAQYILNDHITFNARINNLIDKDFTAYDTVFNYEDADQAWVPSYQDHYNNKDKARNLWLGVNVRF